MPTFPHWDWSGASLLTPNLDGDPALDLAIALNRDSRGTPGSLEIFYVGSDNILHHARQTIPGRSTSWSKQPAIPGSGLGQFAEAKLVAVGQNKSGILEVFHTGLNNRLYRNRQTIAGGKDWEPQAAPLGDVEAVQISVCLDSMDRLEIVYVGMFGQIYHNRQKSAGSSEWVGETPFLDLKAKQVQVVRNPNNQDLLEVYYIDSGGGLHRIRQNSIVSMTDWTDHAFKNDFATQLSVGTNADGRLEIFYVDTFGNLYHNWLTSTVDMNKWFGQTRLPGSSALNVTAVSNADGRLEIFYTGLDGGLYHNWQVIPNGNWVGEVRFAGNSAKKMVGALNRDGRMEICYIGSRTFLWHSYQIQRNGSWTNTNAQGGQTPFFGVLGSNNNYLLSNCGYLTDVSVTIEVTQDIYCDKSSPDENPPVYNPTLHGYAFQLNCFSPWGQSTSWQQYIILISHTGTDVQGLVNFFTGPAPGTGLLNTPSIDLCKVNDGIRAGYQLQINLLNDENAYITGVYYRVMDNFGNLVGTGTMLLTDSGFTQAQLSPIVAMTMNLVGEINLIIGHFATGAGQIIYTASTLMTASGNLPDCAEFQDGTGETSNSTYGPISALPSNLLTQTFGVS